MRALIALALLGGAAPAHSLSISAAEKAIARHEGKGTVVSNCKRRHPGIVCFYRTPVPRGQNEAVRTGFDRAVLKGRRVLVSQYTTPVVIECPEDCSSPEPEARNTFREDTARSWWEAWHNQISTDPPVSHLAILQPQTTPRRQEVSSPPTPANETTTTVSGVVTCTQSQRLDEQEAKEAAREQLPVIAKTEHEALVFEISGGFVHQSNPGPVPLLEAIPTEERLEVEHLAALEEPVAEARLKEIVSEVAKQFEPRRNALKTQIAAIKTKAAEERVEAFARAEVQEEERIAKRENECEPHFPPVTVSHNGVLIPAATSWWQYDSLETKAVEEGKRTAVAIGEAPGMQSSQSSPVPVT